MNKAKVIFHIDMNAFFASCELIKRPYLKDKPFAVGVRYSSKGVLSTANYVARSYGVKSAMTVKDALKNALPYAYLIVIISFTKNVLITL